MTPPRSKRNAGSSKTTKPAAATKSPEKKPGFECQICFEVSPTQTEYINHILVAHNPANEKVPKEPPVKEEGRVDLQSTIEIEEEHNEQFKVPSKNSEEFEVQADEEVPCESESQSAVHADISLPLEQSDNDEEREVFEIVKKTSRSSIQNAYAPTAAEDEELTPIMTKNNRTQCPRCLKYYLTQTHFHVHWESKCGQEKKFQCEFCEAKFMSHTSLKAHLQQHVGTKWNQCPYCDKKTLTEGQMKVHIRTHTREKPFECSECHKKFAHRESLVTHSSIHTGIFPYQCLYCAKRFSCVGNLIKHRKTRMDTCGLPEYSVNTRVAPRPSTHVPGTLLITPKKKERGKVDLSKRDKMEEEGKLETIAESEPGSERNEDHVEYVAMEVNSDDEDHHHHHHHQVSEEVHEEAHEEEAAQPLEAGKGKVTQVVVAEDGTQIIDGQFMITIDRAEEDIESHYLVQEEVSAGDMDDPNVNLKMFLTPNKAEGHWEEPQATQEEVKSRRRGKKTVTAAEIRFECAKCLKSFALEKSLQKHEQSDCGRVTEYKCKICQKGYASAATLKTHMSCHTEQRPYECTACSKRFRTNMQLSVHSRIHTGDKPYKCDKCPRSFAHRETLLTHQSTHTGYKRFLCIFCGSRFSCISNLQSHRRARKDTCGAHPGHTRPVGENEDVSLLMIAR